VRGLMNVQFAVQDNQVYVLEVNPRASRTVPYVSKTIGMPLAKVAHWSWPVQTQGHRADHRIQPRHCAVKEAVFPFIRFPGVDCSLSPEMKSTGEVMGIDTSPGMAYLKSQMAAGNTLPSKGNVFVSVRDADKPDIIELTRQLIQLGFTVYATMGTSTALREKGIPSRAVFRISDGRPSVLDMIEEQDVAWIINTPSCGAAPKVDEIRMRARAVIRGIPITTTIAGVKAAVSGLQAWRENGSMSVCSLQEFHRHSPRVKLQGLF
jgi:carbamoyl-phosphate synthase large subunit